MLHKLTNTNEEYRTTNELDYQKRVSVDLTCLFSSQLMEHRKWYPDRREITPCKARTRQGYNWFG